MTSSGEPQPSSSTANEAALADKPTPPNATVGKERAKQQNAPYRTPEFSWSRVHIRLLDDLVSASERSRRLAAALSVDIHRASRRRLERIVDGARRSCQQLGKSNLRLEHRSRALAALRLAHYGLRRLVAVARRRHIAERECRRATRWLRGRRHISIVNDNH